MIARVWYGWTEPEDADEYERVLRDEVFPEITAVEGYRGFQLLRRPADATAEDATADDEVEFVTVIHFDSLAAVERFAGEEYETAHVPEEARAVLKRFDDRARQYEVEKQTSDLPARE